MRILLAEDDARLGPLIVHMLNKERHTTDWVQNGEDALDYMFEAAYDIVILDWMMPVKDGVTVCKELRKQGYAGGILMLTAKDATDNRVAGLNAGADDYLIKPFEFAELFARIHSLSRRLHNPIWDDVLFIGPYILNLVEHTFACNDEMIPLTVREFQFMEIMMRNHGKVIPREILLERIWGYDAEVSSNSLDALVRLVRKKIEPEDDKMLIHNIRGVGYKLEVADVLKNPK